MEPGSIARCSVLAVLVLAQATCAAGTGPDSGELGSVAIDPHPIEVELDESLQLAAVLTDESGNPVSRSTVHWSVENPDVAEVSPSGVVVGKALGTTRVAASVQGVDAVATVTVVRRGVVRVTISPSTVGLREGEHKTLSVEAFDRLDEAVSGLPVEWRVADAKIAQVNSSGRVTALTSGSTKLTATIDGKVGEATIEVTPRPVASVEVSPGSVTLNTGDTREMNVTLKAADGTTLTGRTVTWSSSTPEVASVTNGGVVTAHTAGDAVIRAAVGGIDDTSSVRVRKRKGDKDDD